MDEAEFVLKAHESRASAGGRGVSRILQLSRREVRAADLAHLSAANQVVQRTQRIGDRHRRIGLVQLVQVDIVGTQAAEAVLNGLPNIGGTRTFPARIHRHPEFSWR
jgi:hypothetical protein